MAAARLLSNMITLGEVQKTITLYVVLGIRTYVDELIATGFLETERGDEIAQALIDLLGLEYSQHLQNMYFHVKSLIDEYEEARVDGDWVNPNFWSRQYDGVHMLAYGVFGKITNFNKFRLTDFFDAEKKWTLTPNGDKYDIAASH